MAQTNCKHINTSHTNDSLQIWSQCRCQSWPPSNRICHRAAHNDVFPTHTFFAPLMLITEHGAIRWSLGADAQGKKKGRRVTRLKLNNARDARVLSSCVRNDSCDAQVGVRVPVCVCVCLSLSVYAICICLPACLFVLCCLSMLCAYACLSVLCCLCACLSMSVSGCGVQGRRSGRFQTLLTKCNESTIRKATQSFLYIDIT